MTVPEGFSARVIIDGDRVIAIARDSNGLQAIKDYIRNETFTVVPRKEPVKPAGDGREFQHFRWSRENWS